MTTTQWTAQFVSITESMSHGSTFFKRCWRTFQQWRERGRLRAILYGLPDWQLKDMGITRGEIEYLVLNGLDERIDRPRRR